MQPLQCVFQHLVANPHVSTHMTTKRDNNHVAIPLRSATTDSKTPLNYARTSTPKAAWSHRYSAAKKKANRPQPHPPHTGGTFTLHGKTHGFVLRLLPQHKPHATFMQPSQCVLQHDVANPPVSTHMATPDDNNHVAILLRSATTDSKTPYNYARASRPKAWSHRFSAAKKKANRPQPHLLHAGGTFHRRLQPLYMEKCTVSCSGFLPKTKPMQHSCSHYNAFCSITWLTRMCRHTWQQNVTTIM